MAARGRYWCFTENVDPDQLRHALLDEGLPEGITYLCGQLEKGDHLHFQGYVEIAAQQRISWLKKNLSHTAHFERRFATQEEAIHYTNKPHDGCECKACVDERANPTKIPMTWNEWGEPSDDKPGKRNDLLDVKAMLDDGESEEAIADAHFGSWVRYNKAFQQYRLLKSKKRDPATGVEVIVYYGSTGLGKSRMARETYPRAYIKPVGSQWFDGYHGQEEVLFDEYGGHWMPYGTLLSITDRYPCTVPIKGGHTEFSAKTLLFTTNRHPKFWYKGDYYAAFQRRITKIIYFEEGQDPRESVFPFNDIPEVDYGLALPANHIPNYNWN